MLSKKIHIIFNPASSGGKTGENRVKIFSSVQKYFGNNYSLQITEKPNDAITLAEKAVNHGCELIIAIGGDGTIQEVVNGLFKSSGEKKSCTLGIISRGTGQGFAQSLRLPKKLDEQLLVISQGITKNIDAGRVTFLCNGKRKTKYFINEFQAGIGGAVVKNVNQNLKRKGGLLAFGIGTLSTAIKYHNQKIKLIIDDKTEYIDEYTGIVAANGNMTGGGMNLIPLANLSDGFLDLLLMHKQNSLQRLNSFPKIYTGSHINSKHFSCHVFKKLKLISEEEIPAEADGELLSSLPSEVEVVPSAIKVCVNNN